MRKAVSFFSLVAWLSAFLSGCFAPDNSETAGSFSFAVVDVGQGLAQLGVSDSAAVAWDIGDSCSYPSWSEQYVLFGRPRLNAIIISHAHMDHYGGMANLAADIDFSGVVVVSALERDTATIRASTADCWAQRIEFRSISRGDTLKLLNGVRIECLWPPDSAELSWEFFSAKERLNRLSLCFRVSYGDRAIFISSDIDTLAAQWLCVVDAFSRHSDILIVPHHGSRYSLHPVFFGYVFPRIAIISCGIGNPHGHPAQSVVQLLSIQMGATVYDTRLDGTIVGRCNGEYWTWE